MKTALVIFILTYLFIGIRQIPRLHIDRPAGAMVGAVLMIVCGVLTLDQAFAAIDMHTLLLLLGMMILTVYLRTAGFFMFMADRIISLSKTPTQLLVLITVSSGLLSALFVNDTICLLYTPIVLEVTDQLGVNALPYLLALAASSNIGSVMTVTGNPQNMLIGISSKIPYLSFFGALAPVSLGGLIICVLVIRTLYRSDMRTGSFQKRPLMPAYEIDKPLLGKALAVCAGVLVAFAAGYPYSLAAAAGATVLMIVSGVRTQRILEGVDWTLLLFFSGLFVVMHGVESSGLAGAIIARTGGVSGTSTAGGIAGLSFVSALLSNVVSNVPAVLLLKPFVESLGGDRTAWLALAMSSTLAGNLTLVGSVANLIVVQQARRKVEIGFWEYFRAGAIITVITIAIGILVLAFEARSAHGAEVSAAENAALPKTITVFPADAARVPRTFRIVIRCNDPASRIQGLQGFRKLLSDEAALFIFEKPQPVSFWMGGVAYPIDIIFVGPGKSVKRVYPYCLPGSPDLYTSGGPVIWVIETAAGSEIRAGDRVRIQ